ncbi:MAG: PrsW family intramembrane metalloprotease [Prevotella sp.]|nr:PrsW family intramembrane metalloprotease [Prevotella sp.]
MAYCGNCGHYNDDEATFCGNCGQPLKNSAESNVSQGGGKGQERRKSSNTVSSWIDSLNQYVGNDRPADLNWKVLFTDVFKKHTTDEAEEIFICGTKYTTPDMEHISKGWPHPWLYSRVLVMLLITFGLLWFCVNVFENINAFPGMIVIGSFAVPLSTMVLFMETNVWRNVSMYQVLKTFFVGGCASLVATLFLSSIFTVQGLDFFGALVVGITEEIGKAVIVYVFIRRLCKVSILTGLLIGASVGAGFAAFESAGYALQPFVQFLQVAGYAAAYGQNVDESQMLDAINNTILLRGVLAPGGHVAWAAISGAGLAIAAKTRNAIDFSLMTDAKFLRLFLIPVVLHWLWDSPLASWCNSIFPYFGYIALIIVVWIVLLMLINMGLADVSRGR